MGTLMIVQLIVAWIVYSLWGMSYTDWHGTRDNKIFLPKDKVKRPIYLVILFIGANLIPVVGLILNVIVLGVYLFMASDRELFFHSESKIFKFLTKDI